MSYSANIPIVAAMEVRGVGLKLNQRLLPRPRQKLATELWTYAIRQPWRYNIMDTI